MTVLRQGCLPTPRHKVKNTFIDLDEELEVSGAESIWQRNATAPGRMGDRRTQSLPSSPRLQSSKKVGSSDTSSVIDSEGKETGYDTPDELLDDQQSEIGWSRSDMHSTLGELPPVSIWANAAEDGHDGAAADLCAWQQGWVVPGLMQFPVHFSAAAEPWAGAAAAAGEEGRPADGADT
ncbi:unnamed protein product, partial [Prorocentrum cordatum]